MSSIQRRMRRRSKQTNGPDALPALSLQQRVDAAVHRAVSTLSPTGGFGHCSAYSFAASIVARVATGKPYVMQTGRIYFATGVEDWMFEMDPAKTPGDAEFHCWIARVPSASYSPGDPVELADFSVRHFPRWLEQHGIEWNRGDLGPFVWDWSDRLRDRNVYYSATPDTQRFLEKIINKPSSFEKQCAQLAVMLYRNPEVELFTADTVRDAARLKEEGQ